MAEQRESSPRAGGSPNGPAAPRLTLHRCENSHSFFFPHVSCPLCGANLQPFDDPPDAEIVSRTIVRVSPTGSPFALGLARTASGAQTLCIIEGGSETDPGKDVVITKRGGLYYASPRPRAV